MLKRAALVWCTVSSVVSLWAQSPPKIDPSSQPAVNRLAAIAHSIRECPRAVSERQWGRNKEEFERWYIGPPQNVIWNAVPGSSIRSPYLGYIEFYLPRDFDSKTSMSLGSLVVLPPSGKHRYEFDVGPEGLELTRMLQFGKDGELFDDGPDETCWQNAARNANATPINAVASNSPADLKIASTINATSIIGFGGDAFLFQCDTKDDIKKEACKLWLSGLEAGLGTAGFIVDATTKEAVKEAAVCIPKNTTEDQLFSLVLKYIKNHPSDVNQPTAFLSLLALQQAFPCKQ